MLLYLHLPRLQLIKWLGHPGPRQEPSPTRWGGNGGARDRELVCEKGDYRTL